MDVGRAQRLGRHSVLSQVQATEFLQAISLLFTARRRRDFLRAGGSETDAPPVSCS